MNVLYCSDSYLSPAGGGTHSREFVRAFRSVPGVERVEVFAKGEIVVDGDRDSEKAVITSKLTEFVQSIKKHLRKVLPGSWEAFILILVRPLSGYARLKQAIQLTDSNVVILRLTTQFPWIRRIKRDFPAVTVCLEINATVLNELWPDLWFKTLWRRYEAEHVKYADRIIVVSEHLKEYYRRQGVPAGKILVNHNGVDPDVFSCTTASTCKKTRDAFCIPEDAFVIGYVGGMQPFRRLAEVVEEIARMHRDGISDVFLVLVGDGTDMVRIKAAIHKNSDVLDGWVLCTGILPYESIPDILQTFDLAIFPFSNQYGSPQKLFEYLAMSRPTIGPDVGAVREVFQNDKHLRLASQDGSDFATIVGELRDSPTDRDRLAKSGREYVLNHYTWNDNAQRAYEHIKRSMRVRVIRDNQGVR